MLIADPVQVVVNERQRQLFAEEPLADLEASIEEIGLIHPPAIRYEAGQFHLVAGERRLRACKNIIARGGRIRHGEVLYEPCMMPFLNLGNLSELEAFIAELDENLKRENLTWQEQAKAEALLFEIRSRENADKSLPPPTLTAIATEVLQRTSPEASVASGDQITKVANRIRLADFLDDPEVAKAKTEQEAIKIIRRKDEAARVETLAAAFDAEAGCNSPHSLLVGDFRKHITSLQSQSVDVLLTDPPYGIGADSFGEQSGTGHNYVDSEEYFLEIINTLAEESYRVCKAQAHAYVFCDPRRFSDLSLAFSLAGWDVWPSPIIWDKGNGMLPRPEHAPRRTYECIMYAIKGDKRVRVVKPDVIRIAGVRNLKHGAQKPVELFCDLLSRSCAPGDSVLDCFVGSGTIFPAANRARVKAIGIELNDTNAAYALVRMNSDDDALPGFEELAVIEGA